MAILGRFWAPPVWGSGFGSYLSPLFSLGAPDIRLTIPKSPKKSDPKHSAIRHHSSVEKGVEKEAQRRKENNSLPTGRREKGVE